MSGRRTMQVELVWDKEYRGPTIVELAPAIDRVEAPVIDVRWGNTKDELRILRQHSNRKFLLKITEPKVWDHTVATFGKRLQIAPTLLERARVVLVDLQAYDWRKFLEQTSTVNPRYLLLQLVADGIRKGKQPKLAPIVSSTFMNGVGPQDADVLLRLKSSHMRG